MRYCVIPSLQRWRSRGNCNAADPHIWSSGRTFTQKYCGDWTSHCKSWEGYSICTRCCEWSRLKPTLLYSLVAGRSTWYSYWRASYNREAKLDIYSNVSKWGRTGQRWITASKLQVWNCERGHLNLLPDLRIASELDRLFEFQWLQYYPWRSVQVAL